MSPIDFKKHITILMTVSQLIVHNNTLESECEVRVDQPWPEQVFAPQDSTVLINCTVPPTNDSPLWSIKLNGSCPQFQFGSAVDNLNAHGVYELTPVNRTGMSPTLRLLINDTVRNNGTEIICDAVNVSYETTLSVHEPGTFKLTVLEISMPQLNSDINISWPSQAPPNSSDSSVTYELVISNSTKNTDNVNGITLNKTINFHSFAIPKDDIVPCMAYNFSVTAIYNLSGVTYTGAGCSVRSQSEVLSWTPSSLPLIDHLNNHTLRFTLEKNISEGVILNVYFEPARSCEPYSAINYTLEINGSKQEKTLTSFFNTPEKTLSLTSDSGLTENSVYSFRVLAENAVGEVPTKSMIFYTTDVQKVEVNIQDEKSASVCCDFMVGSDADGCLVVLTTVHGNKDHIQLKRDKTTNLAMSTISLNYSAWSCYQEVMAFDVETNGTTGTLAVPGLLNRSHIPRIDIPEPCVTLPKPFSSWQWIVLGVVVTVLLIVTTLVFLMICVFKIRIKKFRRPFSNVNNYRDPQLIHYEDVIDFSTGQAENSVGPSIFLDVEKTDCLYDQPNHPKGNRKGLVSDLLVADLETCYSTTSHEMRNQNVTTSTDIQEDTTYSKLNKEYAQKDLVSHSLEVNSQTCYTKTAHGMRNQNVTAAIDIPGDTTYSKPNQEQHLYHTLESTRAPRGIEITTTPEATPNDIRDHHSIDLQSPNCNPMPLSSTSADNHSETLQDGEDTFSL